MTIDTRDAYSALTKNQQEAVREADEDQARMIHARAGMIHETNAALWLQLSYQDITSRLLDGGECEVTQSIPQYIPAILWTSIDMFFTKKLENHVIDCLRKHGIQTLVDLIRKDEFDLLSILENLPKWIAYMLPASALVCIQRELKEANLSLGMKTMTVLVRE